MERPQKRRRLECLSNPDDDIQTHRFRNDQRLKSTFESIFAKYERDFTDVADVIDFQTGEVVIDNGHLCGMRNERDVGIMGDVLQDQQNELLSSRNQGASTASTTSSRTSDTEIRFHASTAIVIPDSRSWDFDDDHDADGLMGDWQADSQSWDFDDHYDVHGPMGGWQDDSAKQSEDALAPESLFTDDDDGGDDDDDDDHYKHTEAPHLRSSTSGLHPPRRESATIQKARHLTRSSLHRVDIPAADPIWRAPQIPTSLNKFADTTTPEPEAYEEPYHWSPNSQSIWTSKARPALEAHTTRRYWPHDNLEERRSRSQPRTTTKITIHQTSSSGKRWTTEEDTLLAYFKFRRNLQIPSFLKYFPGRKRSSLQRRSGLLDRWGLPSDWKPPDHIFLDEQDLSKRQRRESSPSLSEDDLARPQHDSPAKRHYKSNQMVIDGGRRASSELPGSSTLNESWNERPLVSANHLPERIEIPDSQESLDLSISQEQPKIGRDASRTDTPKRYANLTNMMHREELPNGLYCVFKAHDDEADRVITTRPFNAGVDSGNRNLPNTSSDLKVKFRGPSSRQLNAKTSRKKKKLSMDAGPFGFEQETQFDVVNTRPSTPFTNEGGEPARVERETQVDIVNTRPSTPFTNEEGGPARSELHQTTAKPRGQETCSLEHSQGLDPCNGSTDGELKRPSPGWQQEAKHLSLHSDSFDHPSSPPHTVDCESTVIQPRDAVETIGSATGSPNLRRSLSEDDIDELTSTRDVAEEIGTTTESLKLRRSLSEDGIDELIPIRDASEATDTADENSNLPHSLSEDDIDELMLIRDAAEATGSVTENPNLPHSLSEDDIDELMSIRNAAETTGTATESATLPHYLSENDIDELTLSLPKDEPHSIKIKTPGFKRTPLHFHSSKRLAASTRRRSHAPTLQGASTPTPYRKPRSRQPSNASTGSFAPSESSLDEAPSQKASKLPMRPATSAKPPLPIIVDLDSEDELATPAGMKRLSAFRVGA